MIELHPVIMGAITLMGTAIGHLYWRSKKCTDRHEDTMKEIVHLKLAMASCSNEEQCPYHGVDFSQSTFLPIPPHSQRLHA